MREYLKILLPTIFVILLAGDILLQLLYFNNIPERLVTIVSLILGSLTSLGVVFLTNHFYLKNARALSTEDKIQSYREKGWEDIRTAIIKYENEVKNLNHSLFSLNLYLGSIKGTEAVKLFVGGGLQNDQVYIDNMSKLANLYSSFETTTSNYEIFFSELSEELKKIDSDFGELTTALTDFISIIITYKISSVDLEEKLISNLKIVLEKSRASSVLIREFQKKLQNHTFASFPLKPLPEKGI